MAGNLENLKGKGFDSLTAEELHKRASKGGKKSGEARRRKRTMKNAAKLLMDMPAPPDIAKKMELLGLEEEDTTNLMGVIVSMFQEAFGGDVKAAQFLRELIGEDPRQEQQKKEFALKLKEFEYKKELTTKATDEEGGTLAEAIAEAYTSRADSVGSVENVEK